MGDFLSITAIKYPLCYSLQAIPVHFWHHYTHHWISVLIVKYVWNCLLLKQIVHNNFPAFSHTINSGTQIVEKYSLQLTAMNNNLLCWLWQKLENFCRKFVWVVNSFTHILLSTLKLNGVYNGVTLLFYLFLKYLNCSVDGMLESRKIIIENLFANLILCQLYLVLQISHSKNFQLQIKTASHSS